jgi:hypothetical protein
VLAALSFVFAHWRAASLSEFVKARFPLRQAYAGFGGVASRGSVRPAVAL